MGSFGLSRPGGAGGLPSVLEKGFLFKTGRRGGLYDPEDPPPSHIITPDILEIGSCEIVSHFVDALYTMISLCAEPLYHTNRKASELVIRSAGFCVPIVPRRTEQQSNT